MTKEIETRNVLVKKRTRSQEFKEIIRLIKGGRDFECHPETHFLNSYEWEGMITIRFESTDWKSKTDLGYGRREHLLRALMNNLRRKWNLNGKDINWVASTEFGISGAAHCHLIFSFNPLVRKGRISPQLTDFEGIVKESISHICREFQVPGRSIDVKWSPKYDDYGLVKYVCKKEFGHDDKHFIWSSEGRRWKKRVLAYNMAVLSKKIACMVTEEGAQ